MKTERGRIGVRIEKGFLSGKESVFVCASFFLVFGLPIRKIDRQFDQFVSAFRTALFEIVVAGVCFGAFRAQE